MLGQHIEAAGAEHLAIALALGDGLAGGEGLEEFEAVAGDEQRARGAVEPMVGAADALQQA